MPRAALPPTDPTAPALAVACASGSCFCFVLSALGTRVSKCKHMMCASGVYLGLSRWCLRLACPPPSPPDRPPRQCRKHRAAAGWPSALCAPHNMPPLQTSNAWWRHASWGASEHSLKPVVSRDNTASPTRTCLERAVSLCTSGSLCTYAHAPAALSDARVGDGVTGLHALCTSIPALTPDM